MFTTIYFINLKQHEAISTLNQKEPEVKQCTTRQQMLNTRPKNKKDILTNAKNLMRQHLYGCTLKNYLHDKTRKII